MRLHSKAERERALREHVETVQYLDASRWELYEPAEPPAIHDPGGEEDAEVEPAQQGNLPTTTTPMNSGQLPPDQLAHDREEDR